MRVTKTDMSDVGALTRQLAKRRLIPNRFSLEISERDAANGIYAGMKADVESRRGTLILDDDTRAHITAAAQWIRDPQTKFGLMLMGGVGNGKTSMVNGIARLIAHVTEEEFGYSKRKELKIVSAKSLERLCKNDDSNKEYHSLFTEELLAIDDLGVEPAEVLDYGNVRTPVMDVLSERYNRQLFTIVTTNLNGEDLKEKYKIRIHDRLKEMMKIIVFNNPSYRKNFQ